jgi:hypothetical protein
MSMHMHSALIVLEMFMLLAKLLDLSTECNTMEMAMRLF